MVSTGCSCVISVLMIRILLCSSVFLTLQWSFEKKIYLTRELGSRCLRTLEESDMVRGSSVPQ